MSMSAHKSWALQQLQEARDKKQKQACTAKNKHSFRKWSDNQKHSSPNKAKAGAAECRFQPASPGHSSSSRRQEIEINGRPAWQRDHSKSGSSTTKKLARRTRPELELLNVNFSPQVQGTPVAPGGKRQKPKAGLHGKEQAFIPEVER